MPDAGSTSFGDVLVEATGLSHRFPRKEALRGVDIRLHRGEIHALLGPNGAGKTTLIRVLSGLLEPQEGHVVVAGFDGRRQARALRERIGLMPSGDRTLYLRISGRENLAFFGRLQGLGRRDAYSRADELLERVGLLEDGRRRVRTYSHGMQKRLSFARALLTEPEVLLIDEATHDLDPRAARVVRS